MSAALRAIAARLAALLRWLYVRAMAVYVLASHSNTHRSGGMVAACAWAHSALWWLYRSCLSNAGQDREGSPLGRACPSPPAFQRAAHIPAHNAYGAADESHSVKCAHSVTSCVGSTSSHHASPHISTGCLWAMSTAKRSAVRRDIPRTA